MTRSRSMSSRAFAPIVILALLAGQLAVVGDNTAQSLPFSQNWTNAAQLTVLDDWSGVPGVVGYRGDGMAAATGVDPQTILADGSAVVDVNPNLNNPNTFATGGVAEFDGIADPTIALQGSGTARAPHIVLFLNTQNLLSINVAYNVRDVDGSVDNAVQQVALQYRVGSTGNYINLPAGYVADATTGGAAAQVTPVSVTLPVEAENQPLVNVRIITSDALGSDEWVGIDDIVVTGNQVPQPTNPTGVASVTPNLIHASQTARVEVTVTPGTNPQSTNLQVTMDLSPIGGGPAVALFDDGVSGGDQTANDSVFTQQITVPVETADGPKVLIGTVFDGQGRASALSIAFHVKGAHELPFIEPWTDTSRITANNAWTGVPSVIGHRGDGLTSGPGTDPQTISAEGSATPLSVLANVTATNTVTGAVAEFELADPVIALQGSGTADAPHIVIDVNTVTTQFVEVEYDLRDIDDTGDNAVQAVALQYRVGVSGPFTNVPAGFVADATVGPNQSGLTTHVQAVLPLDAGFQPLVQVRIITNDAVGSDEWVGIDNIHIHSAGPTPPTGAGMASPANVGAGNQTLLTVDVSPGQRPASTGIQVIADLSLIGGSATQQFFDDGVSGGDAVAGDNIFSLIATVAPSTPEGPKLLQAQITDLEGRANVADIALFVLSSTSPSAVGVASPNPVTAGGNTLLTVSVTSGTNPASTGLAVSADLSSLGGSATQALVDDGTNGDQVAGDQVFTHIAIVPLATAPGVKALPGVVTDQQGRAGAFSISLTVDAVALPIHAIQGSGGASPFAGQPVRTTGVVTGRRGNGFYIQSPVAEWDGDPATSEGVFVFTSAAPPAAAAIGNLVDVRATVTEFVPNADPFQLPLTELSIPVVMLISSGHALPAPIALTPADTPLAPIDWMERFEGMRVFVESLTAIAPNAGNVNEPNATGSSTATFYGVITGVDRPFREPGIDALSPLPGGAPNGVPRFDTNPERLRIVGNGLSGVAAVQVSAGDVVSNITGIMDYGFRSYTIFPEAPPAVDGAPSAIPVAVPTNTQFTIGSANLQRFFDTVNDPDIGDPVLTVTAFNNRLNKASLMIRNILRTPDILGVIEVENLSALQALAAKINGDAVIAGDPNPNYVAYLEEGNDIGGIDSGFLVKSARVSVIDVVQLSKDTTYINPNNGQVELLNDRPPLVLRAVITSSTGATVPLTVIVNHLRSLSDVDDPVDGNRVRAKRRAQAEDLAKIVQARQMADPTQRIVLVGDFNAFQFNDGLVDSIGTIKGTPTPGDQVTLSSPDLVNPDLINLVDAIAPRERYSFSFDGNAQTLDHAIITGNLLALVDSLQFARTNADFAESFRNDPNRPERLSDHDPLIVLFNFPAPQATQLMITSSANPAAFGEPITFTATVRSSDAPVTEGTVTFKEGNQPLSGPLALSADGQVTFLTSSLPLGEHTITAEYSGTGNFVAGSVSVIQIVQPTISISDETVAEGNSGVTPATFTVTLFPASATTVRVNFQTANITATAGSDYVPRAATTLTFLPGVTTQTVAVGVIGDRLSEADEIFSVELSNATGASVIDDQGIGTIMNDDPLPNLFISDITVREGDVGTKELGFVVRLSSVAGRTVLVNFATADGTATSERDYVSNSGTLVFPAGTTTQTVSVVVNSDVFNEIHENFFVNLSAPTGAVIADGQGVGRILNDDRTALSINSVTVQEPAAGMATAVLTVELSAPSEIPISVSYATLNNKAQAPGDYLAIPESTLTFAPFETTKTISVVINGDNLSERSEAFMVRLFQPVGAGVTAPIGRVTIVDLP